MLSKRSQSPKNSLQFLRSFRSEKTYSYWKIIGRNSGDIGVIWEGHRGTFCSDRNDLSNDKNVSYQMHAFNKDAKQCYFTNL